MSLRGSADLPPRVQAAFQEELNHLTPTTLLIAQAAAVADELATVIAQVAEPITLAAAGRDVGFFRPASQASSDSGARWDRHSR